MIFRMSEQLGTEKKSNDNNKPGQNPEEGNLHGGPGLREALRLFLVVFALLLLIGSVVQAWHFEYGMIITQVILILLPALWFWRRHRVDQVSFGRLNPLEGKFIPIILLLSVSFWLLNIVFATGLVTMLMQFGYEPIVVLEPPQTFGEYIGYVLVLSVFAGICEEVLFRGTIMPAMEKEGLVPAIVFSSFLFALMHISFLNLISTFMLGLVMAVIMIKTGSLWGAILFHMLNNFYAATYLYAAGQVEAASSIEPADLLVFLPVLCLSLAGIWFGLNRLQLRSGVSPLLKQRGSWLPKGWAGWPLFAGLFMFLVMALLELAIGFKWINPASF